MMVAGMAVLAQEFPAADGTRDAIMEVLDRTEPAAAREEEDGGGGDCDYRKPNTDAGTVVPVDDRIDGTKANRDRCGEDDDDDIGMDFSCWDDCGGAAAAFAASSSAPIGHRL